MVTRIVLKTGCAAAGDENGLNPGNSSQQEP